MALRRVKEVLVLAVAALVLSLPIFVHGPMLAGHDTREHLSFGQYFAEQFWQGELYPRWLLNMNSGLGSASFFVYPPLPSYVYALLLPVTRIVPVNAFSLGEYLCLFASGLFAFLWMTTIASRLVSLIAAAIYMLLPYHLTIDYYRRGALSECWALAWMPLVLYFTTLVVREKRYALVGLAIAYALLIVSRLVSVFILSVLPILLALTIAERGQKARALLTVIGGLVLGTFISAAYLVPAFANAKYFPVSRLEIPIDSGPQGDLLDFGWGLLMGHSEKSPFIRTVSLATVDTVLFLVLCGSVALMRGPRSRRAQTLLWLAVCPIPLFLMSGPSQWLWNALPPLTSAVQFPFRFDVVLCVAALPLAAFLLTDVMQLPVRSRASLLITVFLFAATWFGGAVRSVRSLMRDQYDAGSSLSVHDGWFAAWTPRGTDRVSAMLASTGPRARFAAGQGSADVLLWKARHIEVLTNCAACEPLVVGQFYYPRWQARLVPEGTPLPVGPELPQGLLEVQAPPGRHQILVEMPRSLDEEIGSWLSALGILICGVLAVSGLVCARSGRAAQIEAARVHASD
jgi:hypothetical protein